MRLIRDGESNILYKYMNIVKIKFMKKKCMCIQSIAGHSNRKSVQSIWERGRNVYEIN